MKTAAPAATAAVKLAITGESASTWVVSSTGAMAVTSGGMKSTLAMMSGGLPPKG